MVGFRTGWYVIYTKPRHEKKVHTRLIESKLNSFLPTRKAIRTWHDRKKLVYEPLFPSYVFIYLSDLQSYHHGMDAEGALYYVRTGKDMARVNESVVNNLKLLVERAESMEISEGRLSPGKRLVVSKGPLTGLSCEAVQVCGNRKLLVRVDLLRRNILLKIPEENVCDL